MKERPWEQGLIVIADRVERLRKFIDQEQPELLSLQIFFRKAVNSANQPPNRSPSG